MFLKYLKFLAYRFFQLTVALFASNRAKNQTDLNDLRIWMDTDDIGSLIQIQYNHLYLL